VTSSKKRTSCEPDYRLTRSCTLPHAINRIVPGVFRLAILSLRSSYSTSRNRTSALFRCCSVAGRGSAWTVPEPPAHVRAQSVMGPSWFEAKPSDDLVRARGCPTRCIAGLNCVHRKSGVCRHLPVPRCPKSRSQFGVSLRTPLESNVDAQETATDGEASEHREDRATSGNARAEVVELLAAAIVRLVLEHRGSAAEASATLAFTHGQLCRERDQR
jgi:hypothetical protein